eukprot:1674723-Pyramimonas_sp.AAC.1
MRVRVDRDHPIRLSERLRTGGLIRTVNPFLRADQNRPSVHWSLSEPSIRAPVLIQRTCSRRSARSARSCTPARP